MRIQIVLRTENKIWVYGLDRPSPMPSSPLSGGADVTMSDPTPARAPRRVVLSTETLAAHPDAFSPPPTQVPCYSYGQKLSKLAILRIACNYILSLARLADLDYSADRSNLSFSECVQRCTRTLQAEGRAKKRKVCANHSGSSLWGGQGRWDRNLGCPTPTQASRGPVRSASWSFAGLTQLQGFSHPWEYGHVLTPGNGAVRDLGQ